MSLVTWVGTCHNPADGKHYAISYNDCCGKSACGRCFCNRNERDTPLYVPFQSNDYNWCSGSSKANIPYHCSTARIVGEAK
jgi:methylamine dehydrogenase light chain